MKITIFEPFSFKLGHHKSHHSNLNKDVHHSAAKNRLSIGYSAAK